MVIQLGSKYIYDTLTIFLDRKNTYTIMIIYLVSNTYTIKY